MLNLFLSYSHRDKEVCQIREPAARPGADGVVHVWFDGELRPSEDWNATISASLDRAEVAILLISHHFFGSTYCKLEMERALARNICVVPLILSRYRLSEDLNKQCILASKPVSDCTYPK